jgi:arylformamidase
VGYAVSGLFDLTPLMGLPINQDLRLSADDARNLSPLFWPVPPGRVFDAAVGDLETNAFKRQSLTLADAWRRANAQTRYAELPGNHFTVIDGLAEPASAMVGRIAELTRRVSG